MKKDVEGKDVERKINERKVKERKAKGTVDKMINNKNGKGRSQSQEAVYCGKWNYRDMQQITKVVVVVVMAVIVVVMVVLIVETVMVVVVLIEVGVSWVYSMW